MLNPKHPLVKLANIIDCQEIEPSFGAHFQTSTGRSSLSPRLLAGLLYLQNVNLRIEMSISVKTD